MLSPWKKQKQQQQKIAEATNKTKKEIWKSWYQIFVLQNNQQTAINKNNNKQQNKSNKRKEKSEIHLSTNLKLFTLTDLLLDVI